MKGLITTPLNDTQVEFNRLCELGGGLKGGPAVSKVKALLRASGQRLNKLAFREMEQNLAAFPNANPWHICFAVGLAWGHLAKLDLDFTEAAIGALEELNDEDLKSAASFHLERGPEPIDQSLRGGYAMFTSVKLPISVPDTLEGIWQAQERWLGRVLTGGNRPRYIGSWNATAMFMCAVFSKPKLAEVMTTPKPILPPGGPLYLGLHLLHRGGLVSHPPESNELDDETFQPGALYANNGLFVELLKGQDNWSLLDVHSGVYMLGSRDPKSKNW